MDRTDTPDNWVEIKDFSPGIYTRTNQSLTTHAMPAPLGAAQQGNTYRCVTLPGGGLGPLPKRVETFPAPVPEGVAPSSGYWIVGFFANGPMSTGIGGQSFYEEQVFLGVAYTPNASTQQRFRLYRVQLFNSNSPYTVDTVQSFNTGYTGRNFYETVWFAPNRINTVNPTLPGNPVCVVAWGTPGASNQVFIAVFPDPANPAVTGMSNLSLARWGQVYGHQGRICLNEMVAYSMGAVGGSFTEEQLSFTDPPNSNTLGSQQEVFSQEYPTGVGAFGSISAGELFWVKRQGGGVIISGDVAFPTITRLPGVTGTGTATTNRAASTAEGLVYAVKSGGLRLWRGADTSEKISTQLEDTSFELGSQAPRPDFGSGTTFQPIVSTAEWGNWMLVSNNWLWDIETKSWWRIEDPSTATIQHWSRGFTGRVMFGAAPQYTQSGASAYHTWDREQAATNWSWQSHPIPQSVDKRLEILEVVLLAQSSATGTVTLTFTAGDGSTSSVVFNTPITSYPLKQWARVASLQGQSIIVRIQSDGGGGSAPVVYSLNIGYKEGRQSV